jgi:hypothetical protein
MLAVSSLEQVFAAESTEEHGKTKRQRECWPRNPLNPRNKTSAFDQVFIDSFDPVVLRWDGLLPTPNRRRNAPG